MRLYLVHHGDAVGPDVDPRRPLSDGGRQSVERLAVLAASRHVRPDVVWHSGKLRARQTAEILWRACNALAVFEATRDLQPEDPPARVRDRLLCESRDIALVGHFPHLPALLRLLLGGLDATRAEFPPHGMVALTTDDEGKTWNEAWRATTVRP